MNFYTQVLEGDFQGIDLVVKMDSLLSKYAETVEASGSDIPCDEVELYAYDYEGLNIDERINDFLAVLIRIQKEGCPNSQELVARALSYPFTVEFTQRDDSGEAIMRFNELRNGLPSYLVQQNNIPSLDP